MSAHFLSSRYPYQKSLFSPDFPVPQEVHAGCEHEEAEYSVARAKQDQECRTLNQLQAVKIFKL